MATDNYVHKTLVVATVFPCLATVAVIGRFAARRLKRLKLWWDDWTALLALVWLWCFCGLLIGSLRFGNGRHVDEVSPGDQVEVRLFTFLYQLFYTLDPTTVKISALLLYKRIFFVSERFSRFVDAVLVLMLCWGVASTLVAIFSCTPVQAFWIRDDGGYCLPWHSWVVGYAIPNIIFDWLVWLMPLPRIWMMKLPPQTKVALTVVFAIGMVDCVVAIVRIATVAQSLGEPDFTYSWIPAQWWTLIHPTLGIITVCLPTMRVYLTMINQLLRKCGVSSLMVGGKSKESHKQHHDHQHNKHTVWPQTARYNALHEIGMSLSGDTDQNLHSNAIAAALHSNSNATTLDENESKGGNGSAAVGGWVAEHGQSQTARPDPRYDV